MGEWRPFYYADTPWQKGQLPGDHREFIYSVTPGTSPETDAGVNAFLLDMCLGRSRVQEDQIDFRRGYVLAAERAFQTGMFRASEVHAEDPLYVQLRHGFRKKPLNMNGLAPLVKDALEVMAKVPVGLLS